MVDALFEALRAIYRKHISLTLSVFEVQFELILTWFLFHQRYTKFKAKYLNILDNYRKLDKEDSKEQFEEHDEDKDNKVSWREYLSKQYGYNPEDMEDFHQRTEEDMEDFTKVTLLPPRTPTQCKNVYDYYSLP